jgi:hypothetical protein
MTDMPRLYAERKTIDVNAQLNLARSRIDRATALINRALDLREQLEWGIDLDVAAQEVADFTRDVTLHKRGAGHA